MASILGVETLQHTNGTTAATIDSTGKVGIGTTSPAQLMHVNNSSGDAAVQIQGNTRTFKIEQNNYGLRIADVSGGNAERMRIDAAGIVTKPNQPSFTGHLTSNQAMTAYQANFLTGWTCPTHGNVGSHFNTSNGRFTAPVTGFYLFTGAVQSNTQSSLHIAFYMNGVAYESDSWIDFGNSTLGSELTRIMYLTANQYVNVVALPTANSNANANRTRFQGYLLG